MIKSDFLQRKTGIYQYRALIVTALTISALILTGICLYLKIEILFPELYLIPISLTALWFPKKGFYFAALLSILLIFISAIVSEDAYIISITIIKSIIYIGISAMIATISLAIREDSVKYSHLFESSGAATAITDNSMNIIHCNWDFSKLTGYSLKELRRISWNDLLDDESVRIINKLIKENDDDEENISSGFTEFTSGKGIELKLNAAKSKKYYVIAKARYISELNIILISFIDITDKKRTEKILKRSKNRFQKLFQQSTDAIIIHSAQGKIYDANKQALMLFNAGYDEIKNTNFADLITFEEKIIPERIMADMTLKGYYNTEITIKRENAPRLVADLRSSLVDPDTKVIQTILRDITSRKKNEEALNVASKKLSILASITRHDIINQIMVALANLEFAKEDCKERNIEKYLNNTEKAVQIIQKQIEFSRDYQDMGCKPPKWQDLGEIIKNCTRTVSLNPGVKINSEINGVHIFADPMLEKIFANLIGNSIMHAEGLSEISLSLTADEDSYIILYRDNGPGIPEDKKELIFKAGYGSNQGYGLYLIREILSITGIEIRETGTFGEGVIFELKVPLEDIRFDTNH
ncbi:PAS domain S-box protein [Methanoplanus limicola]|uniref:histidine kinase n=1 Tax=Methanoplanus limicola DSM 2279 TaxID=937775 RepID=H1YX13_9EURY|nr:PAS domain S-box protein [Methanoplanus limicola]EHQ34936.1 multi-sensor signal transduction histidine kinase [Methanoplanus limicola DSM 2279]